MTSKPHILYLNEFFHPDICASAVVSTDHLTKIAALRPDWRLTVITTNRAWHDPHLVHPATDTIEGVRVIRTDRPLVHRDIFGRGLGFVAFGRGVGRAVRNLEKVDLVIATTAPAIGGYLARQLSRRFHCPYIYKIFDLYPDLINTLGKMWSWSLRYRYLLRCDRKEMQSAAAVVAISEAMADRIRGTRNLSGPRVIAIHDGFDDRRIGAAGGASPARSGQIVVLYAGNMGLSHPFDTILQAARLLQSDSRVVFKFIGDGPSRPLLARSLPANATLNPFVPAEQLGPLLAEADVCLVSQHQEMWDQALPYKVYSILAAGRPMIFIGSEKSEVAGWLRQSAAGLHCNQGDPQNLAAHIRSLGEDKKLQSKMGRNARELFHSRFRSQVAAERWVDLIEELLAGK